jgi:hypothetical protein
MKNKLIISLILALISITVNRAYAIPPPCSEEELLNSSDYAVEGTVISVDCGEPYDSEECRPDYTAAGEFIPETVSKCTATVNVTRSMKGKYEAGESAPVPFLKVVRECKNGTHIIPGSPTADLASGMSIRYYNSEICRYSNIEVLTGPTPGPE